MTIDEIQDALRFDNEMCLFDPFSGRSESEEWYLARNKRYNNDMNVICYLAKKEAIDLLEELKAKRKMLDFLFEVINPNDMEDYMRIYNSTDKKVAGVENDKEN